jgi:N-formylglutamate deformylase
MPASYRKKLIEVALAVPPTIVHVPHSSARVPPAIRKTLDLTDRQLQHELLIMTDWYTDTLFGVPYETARTIIFPVSRLVVDPERFAEDNCEPMAAKGMGAVYTKTSDGKALRRCLSGEERNRLLAAYYNPHQQRVQDAADAALAAHGKCLLVDAHSFSSKPLPHEPDQTTDRCQVCIGTDEFHSPPWLIEWLIAAFRQRGFDVAADRPFSGTFMPRELYRRDSRALSVMIEMNRSLYMDEMTGKKHGGFAHTGSQLGDVLRALTARFAEGSGLAGRERG